MTCNHIERAREKLTTLIGKIRNSNDEEFYEKTGPWLDASKFELDVGWFSVEAKAPQRDFHLIRKAAVEGKIREIDEVLSSCNCFAEEKIRRESDNRRKEDLIKSNQEERKLLESKLDEIRETYKGITDKQYALIETERNETRLVRAENSQLQKALGLSEAQAKQLEIRLSEKTNELRVSEQALNQLRQAFQDLLVSEATYRTEARLVRENLDWTRGRLEFSDRERAEIRNKLDQKQQQYEGVQDLLTNLRIKYNTETASKDNELKNKEKEIKLLKERAEKSHEELLEERLEAKEYKIDELADELKIELERIHKLKEHYENLIIARKNHNQDDIEVSERNITKFKQEMLDKGVNIKKIKKVCSTCEKVAEIRLELGFKLGSIPKTQTQNDTSYNYSFGRERNWKNINPNFTPELVQEWKKYGFTYEECADWMNISSPTGQNIAIKEPAYYAWLRDVKKVDAEWVLNEGNYQELNQEYLRWYQEQEQQQFEAKQQVPPRF